MLGLHAYHVSRKIAAQDHPFYSLIAAAMSKADTDNLAKLRFAFPDVFDEMKRRYHAPLGALPEDNITDMDLLQNSIKELYAQ